MGLESITHTLRVRFTTLWAVITGGLNVKVMGVSEMVYDLLKVADRNISQ